MKFGILVIIIAIVLFSVACSLEIWNNEHLDTCCNEMCCKTISIDDCYPKAVVGILILLCVLTLLLGIIISLREAEII